MFFSFVNCYNIKSTYIFFISTTIYVNSFILLLYFQSELSMYIALTIPRHLHTLSSESSPELGRRRRYMAFFVHVGPHR